VYAASATIRSSVREDDKLLEGSSNAGGSMLLSLQTQREFPGRGTPSSRLGPSKVLPPQAHLQFATKSESSALEFPRFLHATLEAQQSEM
jgi:hypothetical protein